MDQLTGSSGWIARALRLPDSHEERR